MAVLLAPPPPDTAAPAAARPLRIASWNIHAGIGGDGKRDMTRVLDLLRRHAPDVMALQEVDSRGATDHPFAQLREALGGHGAHAWTITGADGDYGHALISRFPVDWHQHHDISVERREPRAIIAARLATPGGPLHVLTAHFGLHLRERRLQAATLARLARDLPDPLVVLGDFNDWWWHGPVRQALDQIMPGRASFRTFPARFPVLMLDRIYTRPRHLLARAWTDKTAGVASDHLPIFAELGGVGSGGPG